MTNAARSKAAKRDRKAKHGVATPDFWSSEASLGIDPREAGTRADDGADGGAGEHERRAARTTAAEGEDGRAGARRRSARTRSVAVILRGQEVDAAQPRVAAADCAGRRITRSVN